MDHPLDQGELRVLKKKVFADKSEPLLLEYCQERGTCLATDCVYDVGHFSLVGIGHQALMCIW